MSWKTFWNALASLFGTATKPVPPVVPPTPPPPPVVPPVVPEPPGDAVTLKLLAMHNAARSGVNLPSLALDLRLVRLAQAYADTMARRSKLSHDLGGGLAERLDAAGYPFTAAAENIAAGYDSPGAVMQGWFGSPGHYANIMNRDLGRVGFGVAAAPNGIAYWCTILARPATGTRRVDPPVRVVDTPPMLLHVTLREATKEAP